MKISLFPGQGIAVPLVRSALEQTPEVTRRAAEVLGFDLLEQIREAENADGTPPTTLMQPAIFTASIGRWQEVDRSDVAMGAGHSLGEYAALVAAGALALDDALRVLQARSQAMQDVSRSVPGGMCAVLRLPYEVVEVIAKASGLSVANDNAHGQVVLSGPESGMSRAEQMTIDAGGRFVRLEIVGPFHTAAVSPAVDVLEEALRDVVFAEPRFPVISNVTARPFPTPSETKSLLCRNLVEGVRWRGSLEWAHEQGVRSYEDVGPGNVVERLAKQIFGALDRVGAEAGAGGRA